MKKDSCEPFIEADTRNLFDIMARVPPKMVKVKKKDIADSIEIGGATFIFKKQDEIS